MEDEASKNPFAPPQAAVADVAVPLAGGGSAPFFAVSVTKLLVMSFCTLGLYELYWFYKHWQIVRARTGQKLLPAARALFAIFFCYQLFRQIRDHRPDLPSGKLAAGALATWWILFSLTWKAPDPWGNLVLLAIFALLPVQAAANTVNAAVAPGHDRNDRFSALNWVGVVVGGLLLALAIIGSLQPAGN